MTEHVGHSKTRRTSFPPHDLAHEQDYLELITAVEERSCRVSAFVDDVQPPPQPAPRWGDPRVSLWYTWAQSYIAWKQEAERTAALASLTKQKQVEYETRWGGSQTT